MIASGGLVAVLLLMTAYLSGQAHNQGDDWQRWDEQAKFNLVAGSLQGFERGWTVSCLQAYGTSGTRKLLRDIDECSNRAPTFSKTMEEYVSQVDEYYKRYPGDRHIKVMRIVLLLSDQGHLTVDGVHKELGRTR